MAKQKPRKNLHIVLNEDLMDKFENKCTELKTSKSEAGRLLIEAFIRGIVTIEFPKMIPVKLTKVK